MVELVVRPEGEERADADAVRVEDLCAAVDPALAVRQPLPVRREQELDPLESALQRQRLARQHSQDDVREHGREPHDLEGAHRRELARFEEATIQGGKRLIRPICSTCINQPFCLFYIRLAK